MFGFFKKKASVTDELLKKIEQCKSALPSDVAHIGIPLLKDLENFVSNQWSAEHHKIYAEQIGQGETHEAYIYNHLAQNCANKLESGRLHVYRGVLNDEGRKYQALFNYSISTMVAAGGYTEQWAEENLRRPVLKGIAEMG